MTRVSVEGRVSQSGCPKHANTIRDTIGARRSPLSNHNFSLCENQATYGHSAGHASFGVVLDDALIHLIALQVITLATNGATSLGSHRHVPCNAFCRRVVGPGLKAEAVLSQQSTCL